MSLICQPMTNCEKLHEQHSCVQSNPFKINYSAAVAVKYLLLPTEHELLKGKRSSYSPLQTSLPRIGVFPSSSFHITFQFGNPTFTGGCRDSHERNTHDKIRGRTGYHVYGGRELPIEKFGFLRNKFFFLYIFFI